MLLIRKILLFLKSLFFHINAGLPKCSITQIQDRYNICLKCDQLNEAHNTCLVCGCNINNQPILLNKLAWADQECPLKKWLKIH